MFWGPEVQNQGVSMVGFWWRLSAWLADSHLLAMSSHSKERTRTLESLLIRTLVPYLKISYNLNYLSKSSNTIIFGVRISTHRFRGGGGAQTSNPSQMPSRAPCPTIVYWNVWYFFLDDSLWVGCAMYIVMMFWVLPFEDAYSLSANGFQIQDLVRSGNRQGVWFFFTGMISSDGINWVVSLLFAHLFFFHGPMFQ